MAIAIFCFVDLPSNRLSLSLTVSYLALHVFNLLYDSFSVSFISCYLKDKAGWHSVNALASHRCDPGSIPGVCM